MYDFEYHTIIDRTQERFNMNVSDTTRSMIIHIYEETVSKLPYEIGFDILCERILMETYLEQKYPKMGTFQKLFQPYNLN